MFVNCRNRFFSYAVHINMQYQGRVLGGALGHAPPPLGRQDSIISKEKYAKLWHATPPFVLGSRTALFFEWLKFCRSARKCFSRPFFLEIDRKKNFKTFFLRKTLAFVS